MALQSFKASDGSQVFYDPATKKIMTEGGKQDSFYTANNVNDAQAVWNQRLSNKSAGITGQSNSSSSNTMATYGGQPTIDLNKIYSDATNTDEIKKLRTELDTKKQQYNQAMTSINNNPWAGEATRVGKLKKLGDTAGAELSRIEGVLNQRMADAQIKTNIATQQYNINNQQYQNELSKLNMLMSSGGLLDVGGSELAQIAMATGIPTSALKGIQNKIKADSVKSQAITNTDDNGNVTVSIIDMNTGKIISQNSLGKIAGSSGKAVNPFDKGQAGYIEAVNEMTNHLRSVAGADGRVSPNDYATLRNQWASSAVLDPKDFDETFKGFINPVHAQDYLVGYSNPNVDPFAEFLKNNK